MRFFPAAVLLAAFAAGLSVSAIAEEPPALTVLVMDPLALPLSCPCVKGHAQRLYDKLGSYLEKQLGQPVNVLFSDDLAKVLRNKTKDIDVIIGKRSVVRFDAKISKLDVRPAMMLTGQDGKTSVTGLIVVRKDDAAMRIADLKGYMVLFGPPDCDEKFKAAGEALQKAGIELPAKIETRPGCSDSVVEMLEHPERPTAAVISSYAAALLEGCGTIEKGSIRVIGETEPVPFVTVFFTDRIDEARGRQICRGLASVKDRDGDLDRVRRPAGRKKKNRPIGRNRQTSRRKKKVAADDDDWPGFRGPCRNGIVARLPARLPDRAKIAWSKPLNSRGLAGVAATSEYVLVADRTATDSGDLFRCLDAATGSQRWQFTYPTSGTTKDYGNVPRATPLVLGGKVFTLGCLGDLNCVDLASGKVRWSKHLVRDFHARVPTWGY
jgi:ABC-type phosphate/phosphonate transport system substrate-binding protein